MTSSVAAISSQDKSVSTQSFFKSPQVVKIQNVVYNALKHVVSTLAGITGGALGIVGGAVLVVIGSAIGIGSLALHLINLYGMCVKDGAEACYVTCFNYMTVSPQAVEA